MDEKITSTAVATRVQCFAGRLQDFKDQEAGGAPLDAVECSIVADVESGTVTFHAADKDIVIAVRFDELLEIMAEGVVLDHQLHDAEAPGGDGDGGKQ
ncbi:hypothetical protein AALA82_01035 [Oscillospiraceae bacterium 50-16]